MNNFHVVLHMYHHLFTILVGALCPDLSAVLVPVSCLHMIHQATNPEVTERAQLDPFNPSSMFDAVFLLSRNPSYFRHNDLEQF